MKKALLLIVLSAGWYASVFAQSASGGMSTAQIPEQKHNQDSARTGNGEVLRLQSFEYNTVSFTKDSDDDGFMDFTVSQRYPIPLLQLINSKLINKLRKNPYIYSEDECGHTNNYSRLQLHFAFTGRFAQYIGTRYSSPVVGKRFNPYLFLEYPFGSKREVTARLGYGHESNGQAITDSATFFTSARSNHGSVNQSIDYISRGWDYIGGEVSNYFRLSSTDRSVIFADLSLRYYLNRGLLQGRKEEYQSWEHDWYGKNLRRNEVSGIAASGEYTSRCHWLNRVRLSAETGIARPLRYNSLRALVCLRLSHLPVFVSYASGYNGDLAQYGKRNSSFSIGFLLSTFSFPLLTPRPSR